MDSIQPPTDTSPVIDEKPAPDVDVGKRKKLILKIGISVVLSVVLITGIIYVIFFKKEATEQTVRVTESLPGSSDVPAFSADSFSSSEVDSESLYPSNSPAPDDLISVNNLLVAISYQAQPEFAISIDNVEYTQLPTTIELVKAQTDQPNSVIRLFDQDGGLLYEEKFSITTSIWVEGVDMDPFSELVSEGTEDLIVPVPSGSVPARVDITSNENTLFDTYDISSSQASDAEGVVLGESSGSFVIAVISENNAANFLPQAYSATLRMVRTISPWSKYEENVEVRSITNSSISLGCRIVRGGTGMFYPFCPNQGRIASAVSSAIGHWDAIVVINNIDCACGMVAFRGSSFSPILAIGKSAYSELIAHELGHAVGHMTDEYMYKYGGIHFMGPNCFASEAACRQAIEPYKEDRTAKCDEGCNTTRTWRPASLMMFNNLRPGRFGPLEKCEMEKKIAQILGKEADCFSEEEESPEPSGDFFGGHR